MRIERIKIHNYRSIKDGEIELENYSALVGANNAGKSTFINAVRSFYDDLKWSKQDLPRVGALDEESWVEISFRLTQDEWSKLADKYKTVAEGTLTVRRYFQSKERVKAGNSNIFAYTSEGLDSENFYGAKNVGSAKLGTILYIPAMSTAADQMKMSGPSPLRDVLNFVLKKVVQSSPAFQNVTTSFEAFNTEANGDDGFLSRITIPLNEAFAGWEVQMLAAIRTISAEDVTKNLLSISFQDRTIGGDGFSIDSFGHGFQRAVIFEMVKLADRFRDTKIASSDFSPDFTLVLFEEPEAFLHPTQQDELAFSLQHLASGENQQIIVTTHSPTFASRSAASLPSITRVSRDNGITSFHQALESEGNTFFTKTRGIVAVLQNFVDRADIQENQKSAAREMILDPPNEEIAEQEDKYRFSIWLESERANLFFANEVLLVEGATERVLLNYLLTQRWADLRSRRIYVLDSMGKLNMHRFMALAEAYGIPHAVLVDDDHNRNYHLAVNSFIESQNNNFTRAAPVFLEGCLETFLGLDLPGRPESKPMEILKWVSGTPDEASLSRLREKVNAALGLQLQA